MAMLMSGHTMHRVLVGVLGTGAIAGAMLLGGAAVAVAEPAPAPPTPTEQPAGCTAGDVATTSGSVGAAMGQYLFAHPDVNNFFTSLRGAPNEEIQNRVQTYLDGNPQVKSEITGIRQPLTDLRSRCDMPEPPTGS